MTSPAVGALAQSLRRLENLTFVLDADRRGVGNAISSIELTMRTLTEATGRRLPVQWQGDDERGYIRARLCQPPPAPTGDILEDSRPEMSIWGQLQEERRDLHRRLVALRRHVRSWCECCREAAAALQAMPPGLVDDPKSAPLERWTVRLRQTLRDVPAPLAGYLHGQRWAALVWLWAMDRDTEPSPGPLFAYGASLRPFADEVAALAAAQLSEESNEAAGVGDDPPAASPRPGEWSMLYRMSDIGTKLGCEGRSRTVKTRLRQLGSSLCEVERQNYRVRLDTMDPVYRKRFDGR